MTYFIQPFKNHYKVKEYILYIVVPLNLIQMHKVLACNSFRSKLMHHAFNIKKKQDRMKVVSSCSNKLRWNIIVFPGSAVHKQVLWFN